MEQAAALIRSCSRTYSTSYNLPPSTTRRRTRMGTKLSTYTDDKETEDHVPAEEESDGDVLMFHGIILRTQLVEMIKNKVFFSEGELVRRIV